MLFFLTLNISELIFWEPGLAPVLLFYLRQIIYTMILAIFVRKKSFSFACAV